MLFLVLIIRMCVMLSGCVMCLVLIVVWKMLFVFNIVVCLMFVLW